PWCLRIATDAPDISSINTSLSSDLLIEKHRTLPKEDHTGSFIILTMGLFIEALTILAANRSLKLSYEMYQPPSQFTPEHIARASEQLLPFAKLRLNPSEHAGKMPEARMQDARARDDTGARADDSRL